MKIKEAAKKAKAAGYTTVYSIVKTHYSTTYVHAIPIDDVISNGWSACPKKASYGWHGPYGSKFNDLPTMAINKSDMIKKFF